MASAAVLAFWAFLMLAGDTPIGRVIRRLLIDIPAGIMNRITRGHILLSLVFVSLLVFVAWLGGADGIQLLGMTMPETLGWLMTFEISAYLDALAVAVAVASLLRLNCAKVWIVTRLRAPNPRPRLAGRRNRRRPRTPPANDDEGGAFAFAC